MRKIEKEYIDLINQSLKAKDEIIDDLLRINESVVRETRELVYSLKEYIKSIQPKEIAKKESK